VFNEEVEEHKVLINSW